MASVFSHAITAFAAGKLISQKGFDRKAIILGMICSAIPDLDAIGFWMGVPYHSFWGHRGFTHSFCFAALLAVFCAFIFYPKEKILSKSFLLKGLYFFIATASHPVLDAMTNGGLGVAFFAPFDNTRYFFPFRPISVSPISISVFFSERGLEVLKSEFIWIWAPSLMLILITVIFKRKRESE